ncbi:universal stress protein [Methylocystis sp.]|uniref:universal stress protein n=1 Tax=Methylocystis sp. TaxID=1911079 RepID=UPI003DA3458B
MTNNSITPGSVVVGYSGERDAEDALTWAAEQAAAENRPLAIVHVLEPVGGFATSSLAAAYMVLDDIEDAVVQGGRAILAGGAAHLNDRFANLDVRLHLFHGAPERVLREAGEHAAMVVVGSRGRGRLATALLGSVSVSVASNAPCPVVVVRPFHHGKVRNGVLVGTDCGKHTRSTLEFAYREASLRQLPLTVVHSVQSVFLEGVVDADTAGDAFEEHRRELAEAVAGLAEKFPEVPVRTRLAAGPPDRWLVSQSESMNLVVLGHHRRGGLADRLAIGSYAPMVVERAACPVAVVFEAPSA